ncbi:MAG: hypothetical protein V9G10_14875 [Candidatus Nanopelagicales bacterium]
MKTPLPMPQIRSAIGYDVVGRNLLRVQRMRDERAATAYTPDVKPPR